MAPEVRDEKNSTTAMPTAKTIAASTGSIAIRVFKFMPDSNSSCVSNDLPGSMAPRPPTTARRAAAEAARRRRQSTLSTTFTEPSTADFSM